MVFIQFVVVFFVKKPTVILSELLNIKSLYENCFFFNLSQIIVNLGFCFVIELSPLILSSFHIKIYNFKLRLISKLMKSFRKLKKTL